MMKKGFLITSSSSTKKKKKALDKKGSNNCSTSTSSCNHKINKNENGIIMKRGFLNSNNNKNNNTKTSINADHDDDDPATARLIRTKKFCTSESNTTSTGNSNGTLNWSRGFLNHQTGTSTNTNTSMNVLSKSSPSTTSTTSSSILLACEKNATTTDKNETTTTSSTHKSTCSSSTINTKQQFLVIEKEQKQEKDTNIISKTTASSSMSSTKTPLIMEVNENNTVDKKDENDHSSDGHRDISSHEKIITFPAATATAAATNTFATATNTSTSSSSRINDHHNEVIFPFLLNDKKENNDGNIQQQSQQHHRLQEQEQEQHDFFFQERSTKRFTNNNKKQNESMTRKYDPILSSSSSSSSSSPLLSLSSKPSGAGSETKSISNSSDDVNVVDVKVVNDEDNDNRHQTQQGLSMDVSFILSKMKKQKQKQKVLLQKESFEELRLATFVTKFLERYFDATSISTSTSITTSQTATTTAVSADEEIRSKRCKLEANYYFIWDFLMGKIALHSKDTVSTFPTNTTSSLSSHFVTFKQQQESYQQMLMNLPTYIHFAILILDSNPSISWKVLLAYMKELTNDIIMMTSLCNKSSHGSEQTSSSTSSLSSPQEEEVNINEMKNKKIRLLGIYVLIKYYARISLCSIQQYHFQKKTKEEQNEKYDDHDRDHLSKEKIKMREIIQSMRDLIDVGLPLVLNIMKANEEKRTVLASLGMDCMIYVLEYMSLYHKVCIEDVKSLDLDCFVDVIWNIMPTLRQMLVIKRSWGACSKNNESNVAVDGFDMKTMKKRCNDAVVRDCIQSIDDAESNLSKCITSCLGKEEAKVVKQGFLHEVVGIMLDDDKGDDNDHEDSDSLQLCLGGITQCIVSDAHSKKRDAWRILLHMLEAAIQFMSSSASLSQTEARLNDEIYCLRGACSWISKKRCDVDEILENDSVSVQEAVNLCFALLRSKSKRSLELVHALLNVLWSNSNGIPHDVSQMKKITGRCLDEVPESFQSMIRELNNITHVDEFSLDISDRVICDLIKRCILHCQDALLPVFLKTTKKSNHKAYVLMSLLEHDDVILKSKCEEMEEELFAVLPSSQLLQKAVFTTPDMISYMKPRAIVTVCCKLLKNTSSTDYVKSSVSKLLSHCIQKNAGKKSSEIVRSLVEILNQEDCQLEEGSAQVILKYCELWRKVLVEKSLCDKDYSSFLESICVEMFSHPSNSSIFSLFAAFIGEGHSYDGIDQERISIATRDLISICLQELKRCASLPKEVKVDIFNLIAPLLVLRRIPHMFYKMIHNDATSEIFLQSLSDVLSAKLGMETNILYNATETGQERKLLAELVPRCLPFSGNPHCNDVKISGFKRFCDPIFSTALDKIKQNNMQSTDWKRTKLSLYICCHAIHLNLDSINVKDLEAIIAFILKVFQLENNCDENLVELQTGCIDFLATCLESMSTLKVSSANTSKISVLEDKPKTMSANNDDLLNAFQTTMFGIIYNESCAPILHPLLGDSTTFSVTTRTCVLNSFTMAAKRCVQDKLSVLSDIIVTKLLVWAVGGPIDDNTRHPLCVAAFMQCLFILLTRSKSFNCLQQQQGTKINLESNLRNLFQLCVEAVKFNGHHHQKFSFDKYSVSTMRIAALKLLLGIITMDQTSSSSSKFGFLAPGDISRAVSIIRGAANVDEDPNVRKLAMNLTAVLQ